MGQNGAKLHTRKSVVSLKNDISGSKSVFTLDSASHGLWELKGNLVKRNFLGERLAQKPHQVCSQTL